MVRPLGVTAMRLLHQAVIRERTDLSSDDATMMHAMLGERPRLSCMSQNAEARLLGIREASLNPRVCRLAAICHYSSKLWLSSMMSNVTAKILARDVEAIAFVAFRSYDSTQFILKAKTMSRGPSSPEFAHALPFTKADTERQQNTKCKVLQTDMSIGMLVKHTGTGRFAFIRSPMCCPLQVMDREVAESLNFLVRESRFCFCFETCWAFLIQDSATTSDQMARRIEKGLSCSALSVVRALKSGAQRGNHVTSQFAS
jgi:hypothetical protein